MSFRIRHELRSTHNKSSKIKLCLAGNSAHCLLRKRKKKIASLEKLFKNNKSLTFQTTTACAVRFPANEAANLFHNSIDSFMIDVKRAQISHSLCGHVTVLLLTHLSHKHIRLPTSKFTNFGFF